MKNFLFCTIAFLVMGTTYASNGENDLKNEPVKKPGFIKQLINTAIEDPIWCSYLVVVFDKDENVKDSARYGNWVTNEEDCDGLIAAQISKFEEQYPADHGYTVKDVQQQ